MNFSIFYWASKYALYFALKEVWDLSLVIAHWLPGGITSVPWSEILPTSVKQKMRRGEFESVSVLKL
jgi:hypothetical protein